MTTRWGLSAALLASACAATPSPPPAPRAAPATSAATAPEAPSASPSSSAQAAATHDGPGASCTTTPSEIGRVRDLRLDEASGIVESIRNPSVLFVHNDSGDSPRFFAINRQGELLAELTLESVPLLLDAEEIAMARGADGAPYIYLGDTGNNFASFGTGIPRRKAVLYRIPEPEVASSLRDAKLPLREAFPIVFTFPEGARDVEAFFIDPLSGALFMISKQPDGNSQLLSASSAQLAGGGGQLTLVGQLRFGQPPLAGSTMPTAADISKDGRRILVRTYSSVFLFTRQPDESVPAALSRPPRVLPSPKEAQGEAIGFVDGDTAFVTISEGHRPALNCERLPEDAQR